MRLADLQRKESFTIRGFGGDQSLRKKLINMGIFNDCTYLVLEKQRNGNMVIANQFSQIAIDSVLSQEIYIEQ